MVKPPKFHDLRYGKKLKAKPYPQIFTPVRKLFSKQMPHIALIITNLANQGGTGQKLFSKKENNSLQD